MPANIQFVYLAHGRAGPQQAQAHAAAACLLPTSGSAHLACAASKKRKASCEQHARCAGTLTSGIKMLPQDERA
jgi:hypothetical protein